MAENNKQPRRPVAGSRNPSSAPRRIAGRSTRPESTPAETTPAESAQVETPHAETTQAETPQVESPRAETKSAESRPASPKRVDSSSRSAQEKRTKPAPRGSGALSGLRTTKVLTAILIGLLVVAVVEAGTWFWANHSGSDKPQHVLSFSEDYVVHDDPITVPMADWRDANDAAMKSVTEILNVSWKDYDQNLEDARPLITDRFEKEYASTAKDSRDLFLKNKAEYDFAVVGTSVVEATPDEVATLLFLNQHVYKGEGKERTGPEVYPVRVMVRMVRTDNGWLIDELHAL